MRLRNDATVRCRVAVATAALFIVACSDATGPADTRNLTVVAGDNQPATAGQQLAAPLEVRVTNQHGEGVPGVTVTWTITSGEGAFEDGFEALEQNTCARPAIESTGSTDSFGHARVEFMPTWLGRVTVTARAAGIPETVTFAADASDPDAALTIVAGNPYDGPAGEPDPFNPPFWLTDLFEVRLVGGQGAPLQQITVRWAVTSGDVDLLGGCRLESGVFRGRTRPDGTALMPFRAVAFGTSTVGAAVPGVLVSPVTFTLTATGVVIILMSESFSEPPRILAPDGSSGVTVPIGATVEWVNFLETARIVSTSSPPGGASFDSGELGTGDRFQFVPSVSGSWDYVDEVSGLTGTITVPLRF